MYTLQYNGMNLDFNGYRISAESAEPPVSVEFNNYYAQNYNVTTGVVSYYPTQLTFMPKVPGACKDGENVYFYMMSANNYPGGVQLTYGFYKGDANGWTADAQLNGAGAWGNQPGTSWPTGNNRAQRSYSAIPGTNKNASLFRTCMVWDDNYDGIWVDWLHDGASVYNCHMASCNTAAGSAFAVTDKNIMNDLFSQQSASGNSGTYDNMSGQYFFWGTKSFLEE